MARPAGRPRRINGLGLATVAVLLAVWEALVASHVLDYTYLPAPSAIARGGRALLASGELPTSLLHTLKVTVVGWFIAGLGGIALGLALGLSDRAWRYSMASLEVLRAVPPISLVPVALLVFGFSSRMELTIIVFVAIWPILINTIEGVRRVPVELLDVARMMRFSNPTTIRKIILPAAMPAITVGLRLALSLSLVLAIVAEMIGNPSGLGNALVRAQQALQPEAMFAYFFTIGLVGVGLNAALRRVTSRANPAATGSA